MLLRMVKELLALLLTGILIRPDSRSIDEIESLLGIDVVPVNWPIGAGSDFRGVFDRAGDRALLFSGGKHGTTRVDQQEIPGGADAPELRAAVGELADELIESLELLDGAAAPLDLGRVLAGDQTPMFFGSALTNYGVLPFLDRPEQVLGS